MSRVCVFTGSAHGTVPAHADAARALGKNAFAYKLQSLAISAAIAAVAGWFLALDLATVHPTDFEPLVTFFAYSGAWIARKCSTYFSRTRNLRRQTPHLWSSPSAPAPGIRP